MDTAAAKQLLEILIENCRRILLHFGIGQAESTMFEVIELLRSEPELKVYFLEKVEFTFEERGGWGLEQGCVPRELIELAAHELQWGEFHSIAEKRLYRFFHGDRSLAASDIAIAISDAFRPEWEDRMFYRRYGADS